MRPARSAPQLDAKKANAKPKSKPQSSDSSKTGSSIEMSIEPTHGQVGSGRGGRRSPPTARSAASAATGPGTVSGSTSPVWESLASTLNLTTGSSPGSIAFSVGSPMPERLPAAARQRAAAGRTTVPCSAEVDVSLTPGSPSPLEMPLHADPNATHPAPRRRAASAVVAAAAPAAAKAPQRAAMSPGPAQRGGAPLHPVVVVNKKPVTKSGSNSLGVSPAVTPQPQPVAGDAAQRSRAVSSPQLAAVAVAAAAAKPKPAAPAHGERCAPAPPPPHKAYVAPMHTHDSPEHLPTDEPDLLVPARKFVYDVKTCAWKEVDTMIRVLHPNRGVSQGAMRVCFVVEDVDETGFSTPMVAKMFRHNITGIVENDYFNEGEAQCICGIFAEKFNKVPLVPGFQRRVVSFLQCETVRIRPKDLPAAYQSKRSGFFSYRPTDSGDILFTMEPRLKGNFTKYTNNFGGVYEGFEKRLSSEEERKRHNVLLAVEAFSHFTLTDSGGSMLVCDLQGVNDFLTDPQIHTEDGKGLGMGNMGQEGIDKWIQTHTCNEVCRAMKLKPLDKGQSCFPRTVENDTRVSYYQVLRAKLRSQGPVRPEDLVPLTKPLSEMTDEERLDYAIRLSSLLSS